MIATVIVSLSLVPAPHPSLQPAQIHATAQVHAPARSNSTPAVALGAAARGGAGVDAAEFGRAQARDGSCALEVGSLDATSRAPLARLYPEDFARFGYATEVGASRAAIANNASAGGGAVDATRVFADDRVGASDFLIGQELA